MGSTNCIDISRKHLFLRVSKPSGRQETTLQPFHLYLPTTGSADNPTPAALPRRYRATNDDRMSRLYPASRWAWHSERDTSGRGCSLSRYLDPPPTAWTLIQTRENSAIRIMAMVLVGPTPAFGAQAALAFISESGSILHGRGTTASATMMTPQVAIRSTHAIPLMTSEGFSCLPAPFCLRRSKFSFRSSRTALQLRGISPDCPR